MAIQVFICTSVEIGHQIFTVIQAGGVCQWHHELWQSGRKLRLGFENQQKAKIVNRNELKCLLTENLTQ